MPSLPTHRLVGDWWTKSHIRVTLAQIKAKEAQQQQQHATSNLNQHINIGCTKSVWARCTMDAHVSSWRCTLHVAVLLGAYAAGNLQVWYCKLHIYCVNTSLFQSGESQEQRLQQHVTHWFVYTFGGHCLRASFFAQPHKFLVILFVRYDCLSYSLSSRCLCEQSHSRTDLHMQWEWKNNVLLHAKLIHYMNNMLKHRIRIWLSWQRDNMNCSKAEIIAQKPISW